MPSDLQTASLLETTVFYVLPDAYMDKWEFHMGTVGTPELAQPSNLLKFFKNLTLTSVLAVRPGTTQLG